MFRALVLEQEGEYGVVELPVHDHGLEHGSFPDYELDHPVDQAQLRPVRRDADLDGGAVEQPVEVVALLGVGGGGDRADANVPPGERYGTCISKCISIFFF